MQGKKSSSVYFIKYGRVKILRKVDFVELQEEPSIHNFELMYKDPTPDQLVNREGITTRQLEVTELTGFECFGEDARALQNGFNSYESIIDRELPYSAIAAVPLDAYVIKKRYLYYYLDDIAKQQFQTYVKKLPPDVRLRRYFIEQKSFKDFVKLNRPKRQSSFEAMHDMPKHVQGDVLRQEEIKQDIIRQRRVESEITLPKINKKEQIRERLMNWYQNDIPTMQRKVANYKQVQIPDNDPWMLFKIL